MASAIAEGSTLGDFLTDTLNGQAQTLLQTITPLLRTRSRRNANLNVVHAGNPPGSEDCTANRFPARFPTINVPVGFGQHGLPIGMKIIGRHNADLAVLQIAYAYEQATDWVRAHLPPLLRT